MQDHGHDAAQEPPSFNHWSAVGHPASLLHVPGPEYPALVCHLAPSIRHGMSTSAAGKHHRKSSAMHLCGWDALRGLLTSFWFGGRLFDHSGSRSAARGGFCLRPSLHDVILLLLFGQQWGAASPLPCVLEHSSQRVVKQRPNFAKGLLDSQRGRCPCRPDQRQGEGVRPVAGERPCSHPLGHRSPIDRRSQGEEGKFGAIAEPPQKLGGASSFAAHAQADSDYFVGLGTPSRSLSLRLHQWFLEMAARRG